MPTFKNTRTGRVVDVPDQAPNRQGRPKRDRQWSDKLNRMDRSKRWERFEPTKASPKPAAKTQG